MLVSATIRAAKENKLNQRIDILNLAHQIGKINNKIKTKKLITIKDFLLTTQFEQTLFFLMFV